MQEGVTVQEVKGAVLVRDKGGKFQKGTKSPAPITHESAREMQRKGVLAKRAVAASAANRAVEDKSLLDEYGDMAYIAEGAITMQRIATTPEAGKAAVMAWDALIRNTGLDEKTMQAAEAQRPATAVDDALAALIHAITDGYKADAADTVDGDVSDE